MEVCGIVCEYNPFHNGHAYHIQQARKISSCDVLVCVMSGNAVQRGEFAITDKWKRARTAIENGCDLIIELPFPYVVQRADRFAHGALQVLKQAGITSLVFGSECNDLSKIVKMSKESYDATTKANGISSAKALEQQLDSRLSSNDMLGMFYLREIADTNIKPYCIQRTNAYHDLDTSSTIASASAIRYAYHQKQDIRHMTCMPKESFRPYTWEDYYPYIQTFLMNASKAYLSSLFLVDEGIEALFKKQAVACMDWESFSSNCISKRYTRSNIQRTIMHIMTQTTKSEIDHLIEPNYLRILAYNQNGQRYLRTLQDQGVMIASTFKQIPKAYRELELRVAAACCYPYTKEEKASFMRRELLPPEVIL